MATNNAVNTTLADQTGTGRFVGDNTPTLITPELGVANATSLSFTDYSTGGIEGTTTNDNAAAGFVGEYLSTAVATGSYAVSGTIYNLQSLSLTAGDWDVTASLGNIVSSFNVAALEGGISTTSVTLPTAGSTAWVTLGGSTGSVGNQVVNAYYRMSIASTTTVYVCAYVNWSGGTAPTWYSQIAARRVR